MKGSRFHTMILAATLCSFLMASVAAANPLAGRQSGSEPAALPADLFASAAPAGGTTIILARQTAKEGQTVVVQGRVGGLAQPFVDGRAVFLVVDPQALVCSPGCGVKPGQVCAETLKAIMASSATVQVTDPQGRPLKVGLQGKSGLQPNAEVVVRGTVAKLEKNLMLINAQQIHVKQ